jgi:1,4-alpha-glucan branching enzyme
MDRMSSYKLSAGAIQALVEARHEDPFAVLGPHEAPGGLRIRALVPGADQLEVIEETSDNIPGELVCRHAAGFFEGVLWSNTADRASAGHPTARGYPGTYSARRPRAWFLRRRVSVG